MPKRPSENWLTEEGRTKKLMMMVTEGMRSENLAMEGPENLAMEGPDRFAGLSEAILHEIMCLMPIKDAIRTTTLSNKFKSAWRSIPVLDFDQQTSIPESSASAGYIARLRSSDTFLISMHRSLEEHLEGISLKKFRLSVVLNSENFSRVDQAISIAIQKHVGELSLDLKYVDCSLSYKVPSTVFFAASVTVLELNGFTLNKSQLVIGSNSKIEELRLSRSSGLRTIKVSSAKLKKTEFYSCQGLGSIEIKSPNLQSFRLQSFQRNQQDPPEACEIKIKTCKSLKDLLLINASIDDKWITENVSEFLLLESFQLVRCNSLTDIHVLNDSLKSMMAERCNRLERIIIDAPNLESLSLTYDSSSGETRGFDINILACKFLKNLALAGAGITNKWFRENIEKLPFLESLKLTRCYMLDEIIISQGCLRSLHLQNCSGLVEAECTSPNLVEFIYAGDLMPLPPVVLATGVNAELSLRISPSPSTWVLPDEWFQRLRKFLASFGHCKTVTLAVDQAFLFPAELREGLLPPFYDLKHLKLVFAWKTTPVVGLVDTALWLAPHPEILTLVSDKYGEILIKLQYHKTKLMTKEDGLAPCCVSRPIKCWRHNLTKVAIENFKDVEADMKQSLVNYFTKGAMMLEEIREDADTYRIVGGRWLKEEKMVKED